jgi:hypothetical protein
MIIIMKTGNLWHSLQLVLLYLSHHGYTFMGVAMFVSCVMKWFVLEKCQPNPFSSRNQYCFEI